MEKARLSVRETKKKKIHVEIIFEDNKKMPFPQLKLQNIELDGIDVEVKRENGKVVLIQHGDEILFQSKSLKQEPFLNEKENNYTQNLDCNTKQRYEHISRVKNPAYAPYNFVPLNQRVVTIDEDDTKILLESNKYHSCRYTGWIELEIETLTPLYIRGSLRKDEVLAREESKNKSDFFSPANRIRIPGSSLRGMIRNLLEIVTFSKFHFFNKNALYFRGLADVSNLRNYYNKRMIDPTSQSATKYKVKAGYLTKEGHRYYIIPANGEQFRRFNGKHNLKHYEFKQLSNDNYIIRSGRKVNPNKRNKDVWEIFRPNFNAERIELSEDDISNYINDKTRGAKINLVEQCNFNEFVPCFYIVNRTKQGQSVSFGHTALFRIAYCNSIGDLINKNDQYNQYESNDITESIFGRFENDEKNFSGKVFFEDAFLEDQRGNVLMSKMHPRILATPKPTTFQHYLVQNDENNRNLNHYDTDTTIRGYKLYWHKSGKNWQETDKKAIDKHRTQYTCIQPINSGIKFKGKIRFENLSDKELGALLFVLDLPSGCAHKLGMGKPLGLGSIKITPKLYLSNRQERYRDFFAEWDNKIQPENYEAINEYKQKFERFVMEKLGESIDKSLWEIDRLKELFVMLNVEIGRDLEKNGLIRYMSIIGQNEFKDRPVLPLASSISKTDMLQTAMTMVLNKKKMMIKRITKIDIKGIWGTYNVLWEPYNDVNILAGVNGSGKSTLMDILHAALKCDFTDVKSIPHSVKITFDNDEVLVFSGNKLIKKPKSEVQFDYISTFDRKISVASSIDILFKDIYNTELMRELQTKLDQFTRLLNTLMDNPRNTEGIKEAQLLQETLKDIVNDLFQPLGKKIIFTKGFELNDDDIDELSKMMRADDLVNELMSLKGKKFIPVAECFDELKKFIPAEIVEKYKSDILAVGELSKEQYIVFEKSDGKLIKPYQLSSGEKQILLIILSILLQRNKPYILLMDEPEISLHPDWQEELISLIKRINDNVQIILVTHSPALVIKDWFGQIINIEEIFGPETI